MSERFPGGFITKSPVAPTTSAASGIWTLDQQEQYQQAGTWPFGGPFNYIEDVFSTYLYTGNGSTQTITNGIDLSTYGGLVWFKARNIASNHGLYDTARGATNSIISNSTNGQSSVPNGLTAFNANGFSTGNNATVNGNGNTFASWTFRKQPKFFDVVTWSGNGTTQTLSHNLGSAPGFIIVKAVSGATAGSQRWTCYHQSLGASYAIWLNLTDASFNMGAGVWGNNTTTVTPSSTTFTVGADDWVNSASNTYVAYLFAHNAGGFGLTGTDNVISCGSFTSDGSGLATVNLGYEAQWVLIKNTTSAEDWQMYDVMRGMSYSSAYWLRPNLSNAEGNVGSNTVFPTATGFTFNGFAASQTGIYIAIRRGPMKVPTDGTSVFAPVANTQSSGTVRTIGFPADLAISTGRTTNLQRMFNDRLRGFSQTNTSTGPRLFSNTTDAETTSYTGVGAVTNTGYQDGDYFDPGISMIRYLFQRAPSFFDEVCYTGNGVADRVINHNLGVAPELMIVKKRSSATQSDWVTQSVANSFASAGYLNSTDSFAYSASLYSPTATTFTASGDNRDNGSGATYVAYLFATCAGVSKVGSYTGTGTTKQIDCGFTAGARFVLIKRTDSTGDWYVWDTARGIVSGNDPYLLLNSTAAEVTNTDYVDTYSAGFEISSTAPAAINASGGTFIFLAIA